MVTCTGHIGIHEGADGRTDVRMYVRTLYVRTDVHDVMAIKPNFLTSMGYHIFLSMVLRARSSAKNNFVSLRSKKSFTEVLYSTFKLKINTQLWVYISPMLDLNNSVATNVDHRYHDMSNWIETSEKCRKKTSSKPF